MANERMMCDRCDTEESVARVTMTSRHGEVLDYADLCLECAKEVAEAAGLQLGARFRQSVGGA